MNRSRRWCCLIAVATAVGCARLRPGEVSAVGSPPGGRTVVVLRGFRDWYSAGMDRLTDAVRAAGVPATAFREEQWADVADALAARPSAGPVVLIGFSYGADDAVEIARRLDGRGRAVDLLVTIDPVTPGAVPGNVRRCVNFYEPNGGWDVFPWLRGVPLSADAGAVSPQNVDVRARPDLDEPGTSHATIAGNERVRRAIVDLVRAAAAR